MMYSQSAVHSKILLILGYLALSGAPAWAAFPYDYLGTWKGDLTLNGKPLEHEGNQAEITVFIAFRQGTPDIIWNLRFNDGPLEKFVLKPTDILNGEFALHAPDGKVYDAYASEEGWVRMVYRRNGEMVVLLFEAGELGELDFQQSHFTILPPTADCPDYLLAEAADPVYQSILTRKP